MLTFPVGILTEVPYIFPSRCGKIFIADLLAPVVAGIILLKALLWFRFFKCGPSKIF